jgi:hypothetical protein
MPTIPASARTTEGDAVHTPSASRLEVHGRAPPATSDGMRLLSTDACGVSALARRINPDKELLAHLAG